MNELDLFAAAIAIADPDERAALLDRECAGRPELRLRLDQLLDVHFRPEPLLDRPGLDGTRDRSATEVGNTPREHEPVVDTTLDRPGLDGTRDRSATGIVVQDNRGKDEQAGVVIAGKYTLVEVVGEGGMGSVWRARQTVPVKRFVAVKLIKAGMDSRQVLARFDAERQALALMDHPNIAKVLDGGLHDGRPYFVMELVKGVPITEYCDARKLTPRERLELFVPVCQAIQHAHQKGIIHRDVKPSNVLIALYDDKPVPKVIDFGVAKATGGALTEHTIDTGFGGVVGTPQYMSPEQATFNNLDVDTRSDVYALGVLLYELLTGSPPFSKGDLEKRGVLEMLRVVREEEPPRPSTKLSTAHALPTLSANRGTEPHKLAGLLRNELDWIVMKALEKDRSRRYETANGFAADVQCYLAGEAVQAHPPSAAYRLKKFVRRNRPQVIAAGLVLFVLLTGMVGTSLGLVRAEQQKKIARAAERSEAGQRAIAVEQAELATKELHTSRRLLYASDMNLAQQAWQAGTIGRARAALERHLPQAGQPDLRGFEWRYLWRLCQDGSRHTLRAHTTKVTSVAFSPDGRTLVTAAEDHSVRFWDVATWRHVKLVVPGPRSVAFDPDGKTLAIANGSRITLWDVAARCERAMLSHGSVVEALAFSPDGKLLAAGCLDNTVRLWDVATQRQVGTLRGHTQEIQTVAFSRDGKILASGSLDNTVRLWDAAALKEITTFRRHTSQVRSLSFSSDGKTLASTGLDGTVQLYDLVTTQWRTSLPWQRTTIEPVTFSPDGKALATGGGDGTIRVWDPETKNVVAMLGGHTDPIKTLAYAPDGNTLVSGCYDGTVKVWDVTSKRDPTILTDLKPSFGSIAFSSDGKTLAVGDQPNRSIKLWDTASRRQIAALQGDRGPVGCMTIAPDGQSVAAGSGDTVLLWNMRTKNQMTEFRHIGQVDSIDFSPDGKLLAAGGGPGSGTVLVWDRDTGRRVAVRIPGRIIRFSPDGKLLAIGSEQTVRLWDVATWQELVTFREHTEPVLSMAFAPDGKILATSDWGGTLRLWDVAQKRQVLSRRADFFGLLVFSPDGRRLVSGGGVARFWDVGVLQELAALTSDDGPAERAARERLWAAAAVASLTRGHDGGVICGAFAPDGNSLATGSLDATVRLWLAPPLPAALAETVESPTVLPPTDTFRLFSLELHDNAKAMLAAERGASRVDVTAVDGTIWHAQLVQSFDDLHEGANYTVRFRARADVPRPIQLVGIIGEPNYHGIGLSEVVSLTQDLRGYEFKFQAKDLAAKNMIQLHLGERTGTVWIADFTLTKEPK